MESKCLHASYFVHACYESESVHFVHAGRHILAWCDLSGLWGHMQMVQEVVRCGKGVAYLTSLRCPTDIDLQLAKACYPCSR